MAIFILVSIALVLVGPTLAEHLANSVQARPAFQWAVVDPAVADGLWPGRDRDRLIYYFAPDAEQDWTWITPGSVLATLLWMIVSLVFKLYITYFGNYNETYGTLGAFIVLLTWFYLSGFSRSSSAQR